MRQYRKSKPHRGLIPFHRRPAVLCKATGVLSCHCVGRVAILNVIEVVDPESATLAADAVMASRRPAKTSGRTIRHLPRSNGGTKQHINHVYENGSVTSSVTDLTNQIEISLGGILACAKTHSSRDFTHVHKRSRGRRRNYTWSERVCESNHRKRHVTHINNAHRPRRDADRNKTRKQTQRSMKTHTHVTALKCRHTYTY